MKYPRPRHAPRKLAQIKSARRRRRGYDDRAFDEDDMDIPEVALGPVDNAPAS